MPAVAVVAGLATVAGTAYGIVSSEDAKKQQDKQLKRQAAAVQREQMNQQASHEALLEAIADYDRQQGQVAEQNAVVNANSAYSTNQLLQNVVWIALAGVGLFALWRVIKKLKLF